MKWINYRAVHRKASISKILIRYTKKALKTSLNTSINSLIEIMQHIAGKFSTQRLFFSSCPHPLVQCQKAKEHTSHTDTCWNEEFWASGWMKNSRPVLWNRGLSYFGWWNLVLLQFLIKTEVVSRFWWISVHGHDVTKARKSCGSIWGTMMSTAGFQDMKS